MIVAGAVLYAVATFLFVSTTHPAWFTFFRLLEGIGAAAITRPHRLWWRNYLPSRPAAGRTDG